MSIKTAKSGPQPSIAQSRMAHYPVTFFSVGMGMMGLTLAIGAAERGFGLSPLASRAALALSVALLAGVSLGYVSRWSPIRPRCGPSGTTRFGSPSSRQSRSRFCCCRGRCWTSCRVWPIRCG